MIVIDRNKLLKETELRTSRSGGSGGQHVNKVSSRVELLFHIESSALFDAEQKAILLQRLAERLNKSGVLRIVCSIERSQFLNRELALDKLLHLLQTTLIVRKNRTATKPTLSSQNKRMEKKIKQGIKKERRGKISWDE